MKRFLFAAALAALFASVGTSEEKSVVVTAAPVMASGPVVESTSAQTRRGLFSRLRNRNSGTTMAASAPATPVTVPVTTAAPTTTAVPMPTTPSVPAPMPMPGTKTNTMVTPEVPNGIVLVGGTTTATDRDVAPATYTEMTPTPAPTTASTVPARRGLFGRLRNR